ncbi:MAG: Phosphoribosylformylglycinamidine synthase, glutamine amidotransferase subunit, partial [uncultured Rubellimicrobium sp.]
EGRRRRLSRFQLRPRPCRRSAERRRRGHDGMAQGRRAASGHRPRRRSGWLLLRRLPPLRRHRRAVPHRRGGQVACQARRLCPGRLQRLSGPDGDAPPPGRADAQRGPQVHLPDRGPARGDGRQPLHPRLRQGGHCPFPHRPPRRQLLRRRGYAAAPPGRGPDRLYLRRSSERLRARHRGHPVRQPTRPRDDAASRTRGRTCARKYRWAGAFPRAARSTRDGL